ncbi:hypothetical protein H0H81_010726 [Sphagnurus paluster]|uniref:Uncharacterized protein n=1 Tax=Sphagnurus paluster TaxID=117069 RepID=A0A9P7KKS2_9AGAR|nr:hypothetical protein H0H81_010726 [Sphagnurus paluster]
MYRALKSISKSKRPRFQGCFSVVAKKDADHMTRAKLVVDELRKIAKISFEHSKPINPIVGTSKSYHISFNCTCLASRPPKHIAATQPQGDLSSWAGLQTKTTDPELSTRCKGKVMVAAESDTSHFLGIPGQKIIVTIEH